MNATMHHIRMFFTLEPLRTPEWTRYNKLPNIALISKIGFSAGVLHALWLVACGVWCCGLATFPVCWSIFSKSIQNLILKYKVENVFFLYYVKTYSKYMFICILPPQYLNLFYYSFRPSNICSFSVDLVLWTSISHRCDSWLFLSKSYKWLQFAVLRGNFWVWIFMWRCHCNTFTWFRLQLA